MFILEINIEKLMKINNNINNLKKKVIYVKKMHFF